MPNHRGWRELDSNERRFSGPAAVVLAAISPQYPMSLGAPSFSLLKMPAEMPPLSSGYHESTWTSLDDQTLLFYGFLGIFRDFWTSLDVTGSLWKWDG